MKAFWDGRYGEPGFFYGEAPNDFLVEVAGRLPPGRVLCLGEGEGRNAVYLAQRGLVVTAVDQSAVGLAKAEALAARHGVTLETVVADLGDFDVGTGWSAIVSVWCHLPSELRTKLHAAVEAGLQPGGVFVIVSYTPDQITLGRSGPKDPDMLLTAARLKVELPGLRWELIEERRCDIHEGPYHDGLSAVVVGVGVRD
jgi:SAM-dependent methyltransferase